MDIPMLTPQQALDVLEHYAKTGKYEGNGDEFRRVADVINFLLNSLEDAARNEYIVDHMCREDYLALSEEYDELPEDP